MASPEKSLGGRKPQKSEKKKKDKKSRHKIKRVVIEPADNGGFMVRHEHHPDDMSPEDAAGGSMPQTPPDETHALGGPDELAQHIGSTFGASAPPPQGGGDQGAPGGAGGM